MIPPRQDSRRGQSTRYFYVTLSAMVEGSGEENNAYAILDVLRNNGIRITGFRKQKSYSSL